MRHPICIRCAASDAVDLARGLLYGWAKAWCKARSLGHPPSVAWLWWMCWYWPGYTHPHVWGVECKHGVKPNQRQTPDTGEKGA